MLGKTKKFNYERFAAILDYILCVEADNCYEVEQISRTADFNACVSYF